MTGEMKNRGFRFGYRRLFLSVALVLSLIVILSIISADDSDAESGKCGTDVYWDYTDHTLTISGTGSMNNYSPLMDTTPWKSYRSSIKTVIIEDGVTSVGNYAFRDYNAITDVVIADSVTSLGPHSFGRCHGIKHLTMPISVNSVKDMAFPAFQDCDAIETVTLTVGNGTGHDYVNGVSESDYRCTPFYYSKNSLNEVVIYNGVMHIGHNTFRDCSSIRTVSIDDSVTSIGNYAFSGCTSIDSLTLSEITTSIGNYAFSGCKAIPTLKIPETVIALGQYSFQNCSGIRQLTIPISLNAVTSNTAPAFRGCVNIEKVVFTYGNGIAQDYTMDAESMEPSCLYTPWCLSKARLTEVVFPLDITSIGTNMFFGCSNIHSVTIPETVTNIGHGAFSNCTGITSLSIPVSADAVDSNSEPAFKGCSSLSEITFTKGTGTWYEYDTGAIGTEPHFHFTPWYFSKGSITTVTFQTGITSIGPYAFEGCMYITSIEIPNTVTAIGDSAFGGCTALTSLVIPDGMTSLGASSFRDCTGLASLSIPISLNAVASNANPAFGGCTKLTELMFTIGTGIWFEYSQSSSLSGNDCYLYTPWYLSKDSITTASIGYGILGVAAWEFNGFTALTTVNIPDSVTSISQNAFSECISLVSVNLPFNLTQIGASVFDGCRSLSSVVLPETLETIGDLAFRGCTSLTTVVLPDSLTSIGQNAFRDCSLTSIDIPDTLSAVGENAFAGCPLKDVDTGDGIVSLTPFRFSNDLETIRIGTSVSAIRNNEFSGCGRLATVEIPAGVTSVGHDAFSGCTSLTSIYVEDSNPSYSSEEGVLFDKGKTKVLCYPYAKQNTSFTFPETVTDFDSDAIVSGHLTSVTIGKNMARGFTLSLKHGKITISDRDVTLLAGSAHRIAMEKNTEVPDTVKKLAGVFDVYHFIIEGAEDLEDGAEITLDIDSRSKSRSVYQLFENGNYSIIPSENDYEPTSTLYTFNLKSSSYVSVMSQNEGWEYQLELCVGMVVIGTLIGAGYIVYLRRKDDE